MQQSRPHRQSYPSSSASLLQQLHQQGYSAQSSPRLNSPGNNKLRVPTLASTKNSRPPVPLFKSHSSTGDINSPSIANGMQMSVLPEQSSNLLIAMTDSFDSQEGLVNDFGPLEFSNLDSDVQLFNDSELTNFTTVSPHELTMNTNHLTSVPSTDHFTNHSTPGSDIFDSPYVGYNNHYIGTNDTLISTLDDELEPESSAWESLFAEGPPLDTSAPVTSIEHESPVTMSRTVSSSGRFSSSVGIAKSGRRVTKPLAPLNPDLENDPRNKKRMKNTEAARKSRLKKEMERGEFMAENARLRKELELREQDVAYWKNIALRGGTVNDPHQTGDSFNEF